MVRFKFENLLIDLSTVWQLSCDLNDSVQRCLRARSAICQFIIICDSWLQIAHKTP